MSKRLEDPPPGPRPTKHQKTGSAIEESELELLSEEHLSVDARTLDTLNHAIRAELHETFPSGIGPLDIDECYRIIQKQKLCNDSLQELNDRVQSWFGYNHQAVHGLFSRAYASGDFNEIMRLKQLRRPGAIRWYTQRGPVEIAWNVPFIGDSHTILAANLRKMYAESLDYCGDVGDCAYMSYTSIIQSSGSGKSRMVDEVAKRIFTIPFNIREAEDSRYGAWPSPDHQIRDWLVYQEGRFDKDETRLSFSYLCFFQALFEETAKAVRMFQSAQTFTNHEEFALRWHDHLDPQITHRRNALYTRAIDRANTLKRELASLEHQVNILIGKGGARATDSQSMHEMEQLECALKNLRSYKTTILQDTRSALKTLASLVCENSESWTSPIVSPKLASAPTDTKSTRVPSLAVLIYFDEAHVLATKPPGATLMPLDVFVKTLDRFQCHGAFTVLLSTQCEIGYLASSSWHARPARYRDAIQHMHAPITETPFDCIGPPRIKPSLLNAYSVGKIGFMANFGRPLWRSMLARYRQDGTPTEDVTMAWVPFNECNKLVNLARSKLLCRNLVAERRECYAPAAQIAVLDVRIMLSYEDSRSSAQQHQMDLVTSHMRTVYSIPRSGECLRSGYPSEPILAEAAACQLATWRALAQASYDNVEPAVVILQHNLDLFAHGEICQTVGRLLLALAHDHAAMTPEQLGGMRFSDPISVEAFFRALFQEQVAEHVLNSVPDNQPNGKRLRDVFKDAVLNFTHFAQWADDSLLPEFSALGCFMRHMGFICRNNGRRIDVLIPILLDRHVSLGPEVMSAILIQFKLREKAEFTSAYVIDERDIRFFSRDEKAADGQTLRPYITMIMELDAMNPPPLLATIPIDPHSRTATERQAKVHKLSESPDYPHLPSKVQSQAPARSSSPIKPPAVHPRYSMYVYGFSPSVYKVIKQDDVRYYRAIIRSGGILGEHPHQDPESLALVREQKPFFARGDASWHWLESDALNTDEPTTTVDGSQGALYVGSEIQSVSGEGTEANTEDDV